MSATQTLAEARQVFAGAADAARLPHAVVTFHRKVDEVFAASLSGLGVSPACKRGCSYCCHMQVEILPPESFALAEWLRRNLAPAALDAVKAKLRDNANRTRELGIEARKRANLACALLGSDGACSAYEARPAQCRRFHSTNLRTCQSSYAAPEDDSIESPAHPLVAHNVQVIVTLAQHGLRAEGLDATPQDMNLALLDALESGKALRRWRAGKKAFVSAMRLLIPAFWGVALLADFD